MRIHSCLRSGIVACGSVFLLAASANAVCSYPWGTTGSPPVTRYWGPPWFETNWFVPAPNFAVGEELDPPHTRALAWWGEPTVFPFSEAEHWHRFAWWDAPWSGYGPCESGALPERREPAYVTFGIEAVIENGDDIETGQLYVGGWDQVLDTRLGGHHIVADVGDSGAIVAELAGARGRSERKRSHGKRRGRRLQVPLLPDHAPTPDDGFRDMILPDRWGTEALDLSPIVPAAAILG